MLKSIELHNFKVARSLTNLPLAKLTLLTGLNGSGKSTVLQSLAALRQTYQAGHNTALQLSGNLVSLGKGSDVLSESAEEDFISILINDDKEEKYLWTCKSELDSNQLEFTSQPQDPHQFVTTDNFQYLQADRIVPRTLYPQADQHARKQGFLGSHGEFTADFLAQNDTLKIREKRLYTTHSSKHEIDILSQVTPTENLVDQVAGWLQQISPGVHLHAQPVTGTDEVLLQYEYVATTRGKTNSYRPTHVGFGLTYSLPIIVACLAAPPGSLLLIENPEAHLHPQGQVKMGQLLAICASDGVQILVESHSDHVLNGMRLSVKNELLKPDDVSICYFTRDVGTGECYVEQPSVRTNGALSNWPNGFFDQWEKSLDALLD